MSSTRKWIVLFAAVCTAFGIVWLPGSHSDTSELSEQTTPQDGLSILDPSVEAVVSTDEFTDASSAYENARESLPMREANAQEQEAVHKNSDQLFQRPREIDASYLNAANLVAAKYSDPRPLQLDIVEMNSEVEARLVDAMSSGKERLENEVLMSFFGETCSIQSIRITTNQSGTIFARGICEEDQDPRVRFILSADRQHLSIVYRMDVGQSQSNPTGIDINVEPIEGTGFGVVYQPDVDSMLRNAGQYRLNRDLLR